MAVASGGYRDVVSRTLSAIGVRDWFDVLVCAEDVARHWTPATQGVLVASPSNPTGTSIDHGELAELLAQVRARDGFAIVDEIYLGLSYEGQPRSALALDDDVIVINSFSKYFHMTGWRLGWMIVPQDMVAAVEKIAASLAICAPTLAACPLTFDTVSVSPVSRSVSLVSRLPATARSSSVVLASSAATGRSFTPVMVIVAVAALLDACESLAK